MGDVSLENQSARAGERRAGKEEGSARRPCAAQAPQQRRMSGPRPLLTAPQIPRPQASRGLLMARRGAESLAGPRGPAGCLSTRDQVSSVTLLHQPPPSKPRLSSTDEKEISLLCLQARLESDPKVSVSPSSPAAGRKAGGAGRVTQPLSESSPAAPRGRSPVLPPAPARILIPGFFAPRDPSATPFPRLLGAWRQALGACAVMPCSA